jgi:hypothetical protein
MKEIPIILTSQEVNSVREGRKTQTRRVVKPQPNRGSELTRMQDGYADGFIRAVFAQDDEPNAYGIKCQYGQPGDRLWVRETWNVVPVGRPAPLCGTSEIPKSLPDGWGNMYKASGDQCTKDVGWRPSLHMPRWASRITLEITAIRVERLQFISEEDAVKEGCSPTERAGGTLYHGAVHPIKGTLKVFPCAKAAFRSVWESIHGPGSWDANPWVWVLEFKRVEDGK